MSVVIDLSCACLTLCFSQFVEVVEEEAPAEENAKEDSPKIRKTTIRRLVRRRNKIPDADKQLKEVSAVELLKFNKPDWPLVLIGVIMSAIVGALFPLMAVLFSEVLRVS